MEINILDHNPYIDVLQVKAAHIEGYEDFKEIAMVLDYTESKQMAATVSGKAEVSHDIPTEEEIAKDEEMSSREEDPLEVMRRMAEEEGFNLDDDEEDDEDFGVV